MAANDPMVVGIGRSPYSRNSGRTTQGLAVDACRAAIADAGLSVADIDGFTSSALLPSSGDHHAQDGVTTVTSDWLAQHLGGEPKYVAGFQGIGQLTGSLTLAVNALASGQVDYVLLHRALSSPMGKYNNNPMTKAHGSQQWAAPQGFFGALIPMAMAYQEYCQRYGATREAMAHVVVEARKQGARLPWSYWHGKPLTIEQYIAEPLINDPMSRLDCDIPVHGVGVFILTRADRAKDTPHKPVFISGYANGYPSHHRLPLHWTLDDMAEAGKAQAARLWEKSGFGPGDIDLPQVYDAFSPYVYLWLEALGYCPTGEAHRFVMDGGIDSDKPGSVPVLSGGGALGNGRLHGLPQLLECYLQLSGRAGERQRQATTGLFTYSAPNFGGSMVFTNDPD